MTATGEKIERIGKTVNNILGFLKRNADIIRKKYTFDDLVYSGAPIRLKMWLAVNKLSLRVINYKNKRMELYVTNCKTLAVRFKMD